MSLGFTLVGEVSDQRMTYVADARQVAGTSGAVYVFVNPDGRVWKVGMTRRGFSRVDYTRVFDGRSMSRAHERRKLDRIRAEVRVGARQWVMRTEQPELIEALLARIFNPTESGRRPSQTERMLRQIPPPDLT